MLKTFVMPHMAPITESFDLNRSSVATQNLIKAGGYELLSRFVTVVDIGDSSTLPQDPNKYYFVFGDIVNGTPLVISEALKFWAKELRVSSHKSKTSKTSKKAEEIVILEEILKEITDQGQKAELQSIVNSLQSKKSSKTPSIGTILSASGKADIVSVGRCVIRKLTSEIRSKKDKKTGQVVLYRSCDQLA